MTDKTCETCGNDIDGTQAYIQEDAAALRLYWHASCYGGPEEDDDD
jgi:ribosome-binding protein aMBF1 (putative translation factor)